MPSWKRFGASSTGSKRDSPTNPRPRKRPFSSLTANIANIRRVRIQHSLTRADLGCSGLNRSFSTGRSSSLMGPVGATGSDTPSGPWRRTTSESAPRAPSERRRSQEAAYGSTREGCHPARRGCSKKLKMAGLSDQQKLFIEHYLVCWNASEAARRARYSPDTAGQQGYRLLRLKAVQAAIKKRLDTKAMTANEVLHRTAAIARGDVTEFWKVNDLGAPYFDFEACKAAGLLHLIKKVTWSKDGDVSAVEFYDTQTALRDLGRHHNLFTDTVDLKSGGKPITVSTIRGIEPPQPDEADDGSSDPS